MNVLNESWKFCKIKTQFLCLPKIKISVFNLKKPAPPYSRSTPFVATSIDFYLIIRQCIISTIIPYNFDSKNLNRMYQLNLLESHLVEYVFCRRKFNKILRLNNDGIGIFCKDLQSSNSKRIVEINYIQDCVVYIEQSGNKGNPKN